MKSDPPFREMWDDLKEDRKESTRARADDIPRNLCVVECHTKMIIVLCFDLPKAYEMEFGHILPLLVSKSTLFDCVLSANR